MHGKYASIRAKGGKAGEACSDVSDIERGLIS